MTQPMLVGVLLRLSDDRDGAAESPERWEQDCRDLVAQRDNWTIPANGIYLDRHLSGWKRGVKRPEWERLVRDVKAGRIDLILTWKFDRLSRQGISFLGPFLDLLDDSGCTFASVNEPWLDTSTPMGRAVMGVLAEMARAESESTSVRAKSFHDHAAEQGKAHTGGYRQYGYRELRRKRDANGKPIRDEIRPSNFVYEVLPDEDGPVGSIVEAEAAIIREVVDRIIDGDSLRGVATDLNGRGVVTSTGGQWYSRSLRNLLVQPRLAGLRQHNGKLIRGQWDPILEADQHQRLLDALSKPLAVRRDATRRRNLLTGWIFCGRCDRYLQHTVFVMHNGKRFLRYQCVPNPGEENCGRLAASMASTDEVVVKRMLDFLAVAELRPLDDEGDEMTLRALLTDALDRRSHLNREHFVTGNVPDADYRPLLAELNDRAAAAERRLDALLAARQERSLAMPVGDRTALEAWWEAADRDTQRLAIGQTINRVTIQPAKRRGGNTFDEDRVAIDWNMALWWRAGQRTEDLIADGSLTENEALDAYLTAQSDAPPPRFDQVSHVP